MGKVTNNEFKKIFKLYYSQLCTYAQRFVLDYSIAEEMVSDAFYKLYKKKDNLNLKYPINNYLYKVVYNNCIDYLKYKRNLDSIDDVTNDFSFTVDQIEFEQTPDSREIEAIKILKSIELLPTQCKEVIKLRKIEGLSHQEISDKLNISKKTVETQIYRGMKKIKNNFLILIVSLLSTFFLNS
jgi:RNA polymerase sigma-70 factor (ECF subfamily)